ncbi:MAG: hypothetical protein Q8Q09_10970 [Deltaproteobacteria bacterium]|nr:hypothetical protein [Deltaproteobacteria bacterium]
MTVQVIEANVGVLVPDELRATTRPLPPRFEIDSFDTFVQLRLRAQPAVLAQCRPLSDRQFDGFSKFAVVIDPNGTVRSVAHYVPIAVADANPSQPAFVECVRSVLLAIQMPPTGYAYPLLDVIPHIARRACWWPVERAAVCNEIPTREMPGADSTELVGSVEPVTPTTARDQ